MDIYEFLKDCKGVILVGAAKGHERGMFAENNLNAVFIEALPDVFNILHSRIKNNPKFRAFNCCVTDQDGWQCDFKVSSNRGLSSSIFEFAGHKQIWKRVNTVDRIRMETITLNTLFKKEKLNVEDYDAMICDIQGAELLALQGASNIIPRLKYIMVEIADFNAYAGCCRLPEMQYFMKTNGFEEVCSVLQVHKEGVGSYYDKLYKRTK